MKFALVNEQRREAQPNLSGACQACSHPMVAKCGETRVWHWAHKGRHPCDPWWENETEWHRAWKEQFPAAWQEFPHRADNGEKHIADVKTDRGWVLEFQRSYIKPEERRSREAFYPKLLCVVDGARRIRDRQQFVNAWEGAVPVGANSHVRRVFSDDCALLRDWGGGPAPVFFDFGREEAMLWWLLHRSLLVPISRTDFINSHRSGETDITRQFDGLMNARDKLVAAHELQLRATPLQGFQQPFPRRARFRRRS